MKRKFRFISVIAAAAITVMSFSCCLAYAGNTETGKSSESSKPVYLALGDSITYGYEPSDDPDKAATGDQLTDECFVSILANEKGYTAVNKGGIGNTAAGIQKQLDSGELDADLKKAQIVTITCGGNDLMEVVYTRAATAFNKNSYIVKQWGEKTPLDIITILALPGNYDKDLVTAVQMAAFTAIQKIDTSEDFKTALEQYIADLNGVTATIKTRNPDIKIYLATQYNPYEHFTGTYKTIGTYLGNCASILHDRVVANAETGQYTVADVYSAFLGNSAEYGNATENPLFLDFHPSVAGHAAIAKCFAEVVPQAEVKPDPSPEPDEDTNPDADTKPDADTNPDADKESSSDSSAVKGKDVNTGDDTNLRIPAGIMAASAGAVVLLIATRRKSRAR